MTTSTLRALAWQDDAACQGMPLDAFFPLSRQVPETVQRTCSRCPVRLRCADYGRGQVGGWGGTYRNRPEPVPTRSAVGEALQPSGSDPYSLQHTTTTPTEAAMTAKTTTAKTDSTPTPEAATEPTSDRAKSIVSQDGTATCGGCKTALPVTRFPTVRATGGGYERSLDECRPCRNARRASKRRATAA